MKLTIQRISTLTPQDRLDFSKVWLQQDIAQLEASLSETQWLYAGRCGWKFVARWARLRSWKYVKSRGGAA